jgi:hypothetical protein
LHRGLDGAGCRARRQLEGLGQIHRAALSESGADGAGVDAARRVARGRIVSFGGIARGCADLAVARKVGLGGRRRLYQQGDQQHGEAMTQQAPCCKEAGEKAENPGL